MSDRKLVVLGIPWEIDTDGLRDYMAKFGDMDDCVVMKDRSTGRSRGFGYVTFTSVDDAKNALSSEHSLGNRILEVKVATPKEVMRAPSKKVSRIFVARVLPSVTEAEFRSYFQKYGEITDLYMPKDPRSNGHRGIGFITFANPESVDDLIAESHELGGSAVVVDRATPKEEDFRPVSRMPLERQPGSYGAYDSYIHAATRFADLGAPTRYDYPGAMYERGQSGRGISKKIFVGRLPQEASIEDLRQHFGEFGRIIDVYIPKDPKRTGHRGFGFVTFADDGVADLVSRRSHEICGQQVAIDSATPVDDAGRSGNYMMDEPEPFADYVGPTRTYGRIYGSLDFNDWGGYGTGEGRPGGYGPYGIGGGRPGNYGIGGGRPGNYEIGGGRPGNYEIGGARPGGYGNGGARPGGYEIGVGRPGGYEIGGGRPGGYEIGGGRPSRADSRYRPY